VNQKVWFIFLSHNTNLLPMFLFFILLTDLTLSWISTSNQFLFGIQTYVLSLSQFEYMLSSYYLQTSGGQLLGRPAPSPGAAGTPNFENVSTPPMPYANSPRSGTNMMNTQSPQQHLTPQQQRQKLMQASQQQQLHAQQQLRPSPAGMLAQVRQLYIFGKYSPTL
jgi:hypothetical protein